MQVGDRVMVPNVDSGQIGQRRLSRAAETDVDAGEANAAKSSCWGPTVVSPARVSCRRAVAGNERVGPLPGYRPEGNHSACNERRRACARRGPRLRTIEPGKRADVIVVRGSPMQSMNVLREPVIGIKHGRRVK